MLIRLVFLLVLALSHSTSFANDDQNIEIVRTMTDLINQRNLDALGTVVADDLVRHSDATPSIAVTNLDEFKAFLETDFAGIPDSVQEIDMIFATDDMVAVRARYSGTQTGPMGPFPPTGKRVELVFIGLLRIENRKIAEVWVEWDNLSILTQLGHLPPPTPE